MNYIILFLIKGSEKEISFLSSKKLNIIPQVLESMEEINNEHSDYLNLNKPITDFLLSNAVHKKVLKVFKTPNILEYVLSAKNKFIKIKFL